MKIILSLALVALCASPSHAGLFSRLFNRGGSCQSCKPAAAKASPKYRYECKNGVCRRVEVK